MNFRRMAAAMAIGLLISGTCTWLLSRKISAHGTDHAAEHKYVAPVHALKAGEALKPDNIELISWPANSPIVEAFLKPEAIIGRTVMYPIAKGQPITEQFSLRPALVRASPLRFQTACARSHCAPTK